MSMRASLGDHVFVAADRGARARMGRIVELRHPDGTPPYVVHWYDTGIETVFFPRQDGPVWHVDSASPADDRETPVLAYRSWGVDIQVTEEAGATRARAVLREDHDGLVLAAEGRAAMHEDDHDIPHVADEVAVARALAHLASMMLRSARTSIADAEQVAENDVDLTEQPEVTLPAQLPSYAGRSGSSPQR
jgi:hypothetical protein